jgi:short-subunit dehydrogenase
MFWRKWFYPFLRRSSPQNYRPVIFITGCNSGIGLSLCRLLRRFPQYRIVATARNHSLEELKKKFAEDDRFMIVGLDVTSAEDRQKAIETVNLRWGGVDILVNNAGISYRSVMEHMNDDSERHQLETNYLGPCALIRLVLPHMRTQGRGKIINLSSVAGMLAMPTMASYSASKHALEGTSEALWYEMKPLGINVSLIQPGFVHSNAFMKVYYSPLATESLKTEGVYSDYYRYMTPFIEKMMRLSPTTPERVARKILKVIQTESPPLWVPATWDAIIFYYLRRFIPRRMFHPFLFMALPHRKLWGKSYSHARLIHPQSKE